MGKRKNDAAIISEEFTVKSDKNKSQHSYKSLIGYLLDKLSFAIYKALVGGFFGYIFSAYYNELNAYDNGLLSYNLKRGSKPRKLLRRIRGYFAQDFETSYILRKIRKGIGGLIDLPTKSYGRFALSFGIYTLLFYFIKLLLPAFGTADADNLYIGIVTCIIGLPLLISDKTLAHAAYESRMAKFIFSDIFGYRDELFKINDAPKPHRFSGLAMFCGLVLGVLTFFIHPLVILTTLGILTLCLFILITPEIGVLAALFLIPFFSLTKYPTVILIASILITMFSYIIKLIRGKRVIRMEIIDLTVVFFIVSLYFSGQISIGGHSSHISAIIACCLVLGYFLIVNLIRTEKWIHRCVYTIAFSGTITAMIGVLQYLLGHAVNNWIDTSMFPDIYGRVTSTFDNPNYLATYLAAVFPFTLYLFNKAKGVRAKALAAISCVSVVLCIVFTWSRAAWLATLVCFVLYLIAITRKSLKYILGTIMLTPLFSLIVPDVVINRFLSIGNTADSSTLYRLYTWDGCINLIKDYFWGGIGYGQAAFERIYPLYAYSGIENAVHSHNLYLQILVSMGIGGIICFAVVMFFFAQNCLSYVKSPYNKNTSLITSAALMSILSLLIIGLFDFVWYNNAVFYMYWAIIAIGVACTRIGKRESARDNYVYDSADHSSSVNLYI